mmetsp:Transcript_36898/g.97601  ORF Transcript_36898/g.97601 Transcript_36898/m.97601 type:complete len:220 (+) Transcript_36898:287-946(+)
MFKQDRRKLEFPIPVDSQLADDAPAPSSASSADSETLAIANLQAGDTEEGRATRAEAQVPDLERTRFKRFLKLCQKLLDEYHGGEVTRETWDLTSGLVLAEDDGQLTLVEHVYKAFTSSIKTATSELASMPSLLDSFDHKVVSGHFVAGFAVLPHPEPPYTERELQRYFKQKELKIKFHPLAPIHQAAKEYEPAHPIHRYVAKRQPLVAVEQAKRQRVG